MNREGTMSIADRETVDDLSRVLEEKRRELPAPAEEPAKIDFAKFEADFDSIANAPPRCFDCGVEMPRGTRGGSTCDACSAKRVERERAEAIRAAWALVPDTLQRLHFGIVGVPRGDGLAPWCGDREAIVAARAVLERPLVTLAGPPGAGKTSLAVCMLREHMRRGAKRDATSGDVWYARRARFDVTIDLIAAAADHPRGAGRAPKVAAAHRASVLVLDELAGGRTSDPDGVIYALVHERHRERRPTIITTGLDRAALAMVYGGGIERRVFDDATVIQVRRV